MVTFSYFDRVYNYSTPMLGMDESGEHCCESDFGQRFDQPDLP